MSNNYTKAAFALMVTPSEAQMLRQIVEATDLVADSRKGLQELEAAYEQFGAEFARLFPRDDLSPFAGFAELFDDPDYPDLGMDIEIGEPADDGRCEIFMRGEQFQIVTAANIIQKAATSALPFGFEYACDCDKLAPDQFGGGFVCITAEDISFGHSSTLLDAALGAAPRDGARYVIAMRNSEWGLRFWNDQTGFDRLRVARTFTEEQAKNYDLPIADDQPEWLELPA